MSPPLALLVCLVFATWLLVRDARRRSGVSPAVGLVVVWLFLLATRPLSAWLSIAPGAGGHAQAYDEGSPLDAAVYLLLMLQGLWVLSRREVRFGVAVRWNVWVFVLFAYWGLSVGWSDLPQVAAKRWVKDVGNLVLVLVVLTEADPRQAIRAVFVRCAIVALPLSLVLLRFYPEIGRTHHPWSGEMMFVGAATHKNSLGLLALMSAVFLLADQLAERSRLLARWPELLLLAMAAYLLLISQSATSLLCAAVGCALFLLLGSSFLQRRVGAVLGSGAVVGALAWQFELADPVYRYVVVDLLGRDLTLTTRTDIWPLLLEMVDNELVGAGFNSFWSGERLSAIYERLNIIQAHNGYLEIYLNGGMVGLLLLALMLGSLLGSVLQPIRDGDARARLALVVLVIALLNNLSEATFNKMSPLWFALLLLTLRYPVTVAMPLLRRTPRDIPGRPMRGSP